MENEGQDSLNTSAPSANSSAQPAGAVDPIAPRRIVSSPDLTPPTAISAPLPTDPLHPIQTVGTGEGDLVVGEKKPFNKKWLLAIPAVAIVILGVVIFSAFMNNTNRNAAKILQSNIETIETVENILERAQRRELVTSDIMDAAMHEQLNQIIPQFSTFDEQFAQLNPDDVKTKSRENLKNLQTTFTKQAVSLRYTLELYNAIYSAYTNENVSTLKPYLESSNPTVAAVAERFNEYIGSKRQSMNELSAKGCSLKTSGQSTECLEAVAIYRETVDDLRQSFSVPQAILFAYDDEASYNKTTNAVAMAKQLIEELK